MFENINNSFVSSDCFLCFFLNYCVAIAVYHEYAGLVEIKTSQNVWVGTTFKGSPVYIYCLLCL